ncbi:MAG: hypothetical protein OSB12_08430 [Planctomycetota bacterium]|jgi:hypothetical protein|nr:hypothetical protein [Planctomycetota bacterium]
MLEYPLARGRRPTLSGMTSGGLELAATGAMVIARIRPIAGDPPRMIVKALGALSRKVHQHPGTLLALIVPEEAHPPALLRRMAQLAEVVNGGGGFMVIVGSRQSLDLDSQPNLVVPVVSTLEEAEVILLRQ